MLNLKLVTLALVMAGAAGCSQTNLADVIRAAGTDQATFCARVTSVYGTLTVMRSNVQGRDGDVTCDTLSVKSTTNVSVPMTITPAFSIAPQSAPFGPGTPPVVPQSNPPRRLP